VKSASNRYKDGEIMKKISLTQGYATVVDDDDLAKVSVCSWQVFVNKKDGMPYARSWKLGRMSRFLMGAKSGEEVDHKNHDTLDNRRDNLRVCTRGENCCNRKIQFNKHGYKGVFAGYTDLSGHIHYRGRVRCCKKSYGGRSRKYSVLAAKDYDDLAKKHHGEFACLNFPCSIRREHIARMIMSTNGRVFKITFIKRADNSERTIVGRVGVKKHLKNIGGRYSPEKAKLVVVFDMQDRVYKAIPIEGIHAFYFGGKKYRVD